MNCCVTVTTAANPGAVALLQLHGDDACETLRQLTGTSDWPTGLLRLVNFADIDTGLAVALRKDWAQLMPHGGSRVVQRMIDALIELGARVESDPESNPDTRALFPEARSAIEADALVTIANAASPAAVDALLAQPSVWQRWLDQSESDRPDPTDIIDRSRVLDRLIHAPSVVVVGQPNVGKSTLTNRLLGRSASIVADLPGTTRDWVGGLAELTADSTSPLTKGVAVRWMDTPGLRRSDDTTEQAAIALANDVIRDADVLIALRDPAIDWPANDVLPRTQDIWAMNKADRIDPASVDANATNARKTESIETSDSSNTGTSQQSPLLISAETGQGVATLQASVIRCLGLLDYPNECTTDWPWAFSPSLVRGLLTGDEHAIQRYVGNV